MFPRKRQCIDYVDRSSALRDRNWSPIEHCVPQLARGLVVSVLRPNQSAVEVLGEFFKRNNPGCQLNRSLNGRAVLASTGRHTASRVRDHLVKSYPNNGWL